MFDDLVTALSPGAIHPGGAGRGPTTKQPPFGTARRGVPVAFPMPLSPMTDDRPTAFSRNSSTPLRDTVHNDTAATSSHSTTK